MQASKNFPPLQNDRLIRAALGQDVDRVPVWVMRQAGRYLPEFQAVREKHDFFTICQTPELACEITLQPTRRFDLDAAIIFSDILVVPQALGMEVLMKAGVGPTFTSPLNSPDDLKVLSQSTEAVPRLQYVFDAITLTRHKLEGRMPLIGFTGAPWTLMSYMIEGGGSKTQSKAKKWLYTHKEASHKLLQLITDVNVDYLVGQVKAGAQLLQVFESHAEFLGPQLFEEYCLPYLSQTNERVKSKLKADGYETVPMTVFAKGGHYALESLSKSGYDVVGLDWTIKPQEARKVVQSSKVSLQGNLDPCALYADPCDLDKLVQNMVQDFGTTKRWIANLGHGIYPDMNPDHLKVFVDSVHKYTQK